MTASMQHELTWEELHRAKRWGTCSEPMMARFVKRNIASGGKILDVGCGIGANAFWLANEGYKVSAIDIAPAAIEQLNEERGRHRGTTVDAFVADITEGLNIPNETFDGVVDVCCLQHVMAPMGSLREIHRVLKAGGRFFSMTASDRHAREAMSGMPARFQTGLNVQALYRAAGFEIINIDTAEHSDRGMTIAHYCLECTRA